MCTLSLAYFLFFNMKNQKGFVWLPILLALLALVVVGGAAYDYVQFHQNSAPQAVACTQEAKICPDGSSVGRTGPNCAFAACPQTQSATSSGQPASKTNVTQATNNALVFKQSAPLKIYATSGAGTAGTDVAVDFGDGAPLVLVFNDSDTASPDNSICGEGWDFVCTTSHTYAQAGTYTIKIVHASGCSMSTGTCSSTESEISRQTISVSGQTNNPTVSVANMSQYTDADFGFSFWYPSNWTVTQGSVQYTNYFLGGTISKQLNVIGPTQKIAISEYSSPNMSIADESGGGPNRACPAASCDTVRYFFDPSVHAWIYDYPNEVGQQHQTGIDTLADVSNNTMGGLHIFAGSARFGADSIVPLSADNFLVVTEVDAGGTDQAALVKTIVTTDPSVATPVSAAEQVAAIQAEKAAYAGQ